MNTSGTPLQSPTSSFEVLCQHQDGYEFYNSVDALKRVTDSSPIVGAGIVSYSSVRDAAFTVPPKRFEAYAVDSAAEVALTDSQRRLYEPLAAQGPSPNMSTFISATEEIETAEGHLPTGQVLGGFAVRRTDVGYTSQLFLSRSFILTVSASGKRLEAEYLARLRNGIRPHSLMKPILRELKVNDRPLYAHNVRYAAASLIAAAVPTEIDKRVQQAQSSAA